MQKPSKRSSTGWAVNHTKPVSVQKTQHQTVLSMCGEAEEEDEEGFEASLSSGKRLRAEEEVRRTMEGLELPVRAGHLFQLHSARHK